MPSASRSMLVVLAVCASFGVLALLYTFLFTKSKENANQVAAPETIEEKLEVLGSLKSADVSTESTLSESDKQQVLLQMREAAVQEEKAPISEEKPAIQNPPKDSANTQQKLDVLNSLRSQ